MFFKLIKSHLSYFFTNYFIDNLHGLQTYCKIYCKLTSFEHDFAFIVTVDPVYSERVGAAKKCSLAPGIHYKRDRLY
jgi:hypothetical protein